MKVTLVIVHYKNSRDTLDCLKSLKLINRNSIEVEILIVDNSQDFDVDKGFFQNLFTLDILKPERNLGFSEGNNIAITKALAGGSDYIVLLNNDTILSQDFLINLIDFSQKHPQAGLISPKIYFASGFEYHKNRYSQKDQGKVIWYAGGKIDWDNVYAQHIGVDEVDKGQFDISKETQFATGCCMFVKREVVEKVGLFDKNYFLYYEDVDYSLRVKKKGFKVFYTSSSLIWHKNASSSGKPGSDLHIYFQTRNRLYFGLRYASLKVKLHLYQEAFRDIYSRSVPKKKASIDFLLHKFGPGSYNL